MRLFVKAWIGAAAVTGFVGSIAGAMLPDLAPPGTSVAIHGALFQQSIGKPGATGSRHSFLRLPSSDKDGIEAGVNKDSLPLTIVATHTANVSNALRLGDISTIDVNGTSYFQFLLVLSEPQASEPSETTLRDLKIFVAERSDLPTLEALGTPRYDLNPPGEVGHSVELGTRIEPGIGRTALIVLIPRITGDPNQYLYVYSRCSGTTVGSEEAPVPKAPHPVPEPSSAIITLLGFGCLGGLHFRRALQKRAAQDEEAESR